MAGQIRIGTSGWNYDHWQGPFYPLQSKAVDWFGYYADSFSTVEINNTFYHQPKDETFDAWREQAPRGFLYAVKANRYLTHLRKLKDPQEPLETFLQGVRRLEDHLGPLLYQLPPNWNRDLSRLRAFVEMLPPEFDHVIEFRNRDWLVEETYELLAQHHISLCVHDMLPRHPRRVTGPLVYVRFHGAGRKYGGKYRPSRLRSWAEWINEMAADRDVFAYFNNDANAYAVADARALAELTVDRPA